MKSVALADACDVITDGTHYTPPDIGKGVPFLTVKDVGPSGLDFEGCARISEADYAAADAGTSAPKHGDVLFSKDGTVGKVHVVETDERFAVLSSLAILRPANTVDSRFLGHMLGTPDVLAQAVKRKSGSAIRRIILSDLKKVEIPLPPLPEQRRIAAILDHADALRAKRRQVLTHLDSLTQSVFNEMFSRESHPVVALGDIASVKGGKRLPKGAPYADRPTRHPYVRVTDLRGGVIQTSNLCFLSPEVQRQIARYTVDEGDVIISTAGSIGLTAAVPAGLAGANLTENAAKIVPKDGLAYDGSWLARVLQSRSLQDQIAGKVGQVTIGKLALFRIEQLEVPLPPLALQEEFVERVARVEAMTVVVRQTSAADDELFASLQSRAFRGEL